ncbi:MAG: cobalamin-dependent protein, partial [Gammaproteobacteria bacterium]|nr:cobalamin-dependent protein [Gammaproteobacteria bacterium]
MSAEVKIEWDILRKEKPPVSIPLPLSRPDEEQQPAPNSKARVALITPPYDRISPGYEFVKDVTNQAPSLGLLHLAAEIRLHGYQPYIIESDIFSLSVDDVVEQVLREKPKYVGITLFTVGVWNAATISRRIKAASPETIIIVGGPHISSMAGETMQRFRDFDIAVVGEGEEVLALLLNNLDAGGDLESVPGI